MLEEAIKILNNLDFEVAYDLATEWLENSNFKYDHEKGVWIDLETGEERKDEDALSIVYNSGWEYDLIEWAKENNLI
jgi:hypothetical protein